MTLFYISAVIGWLVTCGISYALGHQDGYEECAEEVAKEKKARCAHD